MKKLLMTTVAVLLCTAAHADMLFTIPLGVSEGHMNVRTGPGANHGLIGAIPGGQTVSASQCVPRDDGIRGAEWCFVTWNGLRGWVSQAGLMPVVQAPPPASTSGPDLVCNAPRVFIGDEPDNNPVVSVEISYDPDNHAWRIFHRRANGQVVSRGEQYAITDWSDANKTRWTGSLNRNRSLYMIGEVKKNAKGEPFYDEWLYDRAKGNMLVMQMEARCGWNTVRALPQPTPNGALAAQPIVPPSPQLPPAKMEAAPPVEMVRVVPLTTAPSLPDEAQFIAINNSSREAYNAGANEMAKGAARPIRGRKLCQMFRSGFRVKDWSGKVEKLSSNGDGKGVLSISLPNGISVKTWNNSLSDVGDHTLLEPGSEIYSKAVALQKGQSVHFSGSFIHDAGVDCLRESSMTMNGSMTEPEYVFLFTDIVPN